MVKVRIMLIVFKGYIWESDETEFSCQSLFVNDYANSFVTIAIRETEADVYCFQSRHLSLPGAEGFRDPKSQADRFRDPQLGDGVFSYSGAKSLWEIRQSEIPPEELTRSVSSISSWYLASLASLYLVQELIDDLGYRSLNTWMRLRNFDLY